MSHADRPYLTRPLAGVDQALGEGRARQPVELLDQLRERLERLDPNHPSAAPASADRHDARGEDRTGDQQAARDLAIDQPAKPEEGPQASRPDRSSLRKAGADASRADQPGDEGAGGSPAVGQAGQPAEAVVEHAAESLADDGRRRVIETGRAAEGEPYRPWFADESGTPWFVEPWFLE